MKDQYDQALQLLKQADSRSALQIARQLQQQHPDNATVTHLVAICIRQQTGLAEAIAWLQAAVRLGASASIWRQLGSYLAEVGDALGAIDAISRVLSQAPQETKVAVDLAQLYRQTGKYKQALALYQSALEKDENNLEIHLGLATLLHLLRDLEKAEAHYLKALQLGDNHPDIQWEYAMQCLLTGNLKEGWRYYDARVDHFPERANIQQFSLPRWMGESLKGKTILVHSEQGYGDQIMFASILPEIIEQAETVVIAVPPALSNLFSESFPQAIVESVSDRTAADKPAQWFYQHRFDLHTPIGSLARWCRPQIDSFKKPVAYLHENKDRAGFFKSLLDQKIGNPSAVRKIGLVWQGNPETGVMGRRKSLEISSFIPLSILTACRFVSLQADNAEQQIDQASGLDIIPMSKNLHTFEDTAALISQLDLVISVDTAVAHLAASMGKETWVLLWHASDWRYLAQGDSCYWYPDMRLFRQSAAGCWQPVIEQVKTMLMK